MKTIKLNSFGYDVIVLQQILKSKGYSIYADGKFGNGTYNAVKAFQSNSSLVADGIVGNKTWKILMDTNKKITEADYKRIAKELNVEVAAVKAVKEVESGKFGGFIEEGRPPILFEGHVFWKQLKKTGIDPNVYAIDNRDILYQNWTKQYYLGGLKEYDRLDRALKINRLAALESASWGMFQIMGFNYRLCGCNSVDEFISRMRNSEADQLDMFMQFIKSNGLDKYLREKDWVGFAAKYNGPAYAQNQYDVKLENAYNKYA